MLNLKIFKLPYATNHQKSSYLIMVLDGTGSMSYEYYLIIQSYKLVFDEIIRQEQVYAIQFGSQKKKLCISNIEPFIGGYGNFYSVFENVLQKLFQNIQADIQANITICIVSDGYEPGDIALLQQQIDAVKKNYQIQFTSIAVGSGYPFNLFQEFRHRFHNGASSCTNVQFVERSSIIGKNDCLNSFINAFEMVRSQLSQKKKVQITQLVCESITGQPSHFASEGSVVASQADKLSTCQGLNINQTRKAPYIAEFIQTSCQEFLKIQSIEKYKDSIQQAKIMKQVAQSLIEQVEQSKSEYKDIVTLVILRMNKDLAILGEIGTGKLDLKDLSDADKTQLLSDFNPRRMEIQQARQEQLNEELQTIQFYQKLDELWMEKCGVPGQVAVICFMSRIIDKAIQEKKSQQDILQILLNPDDLLLDPVATFTIDHQDWVQKYIDCKIQR